MASVIQLNDDDDGEEICVVSVTGPRSGNTTAGFNSELAAGNSNARIPLLRRKGDLNQVAIELPDDDSNNNNNSDDIVPTRLMSSFAAEPSQLANVLDRGAFGKVAGPKSPANAWLDPEAIHSLVAEYPFLPRSKIESLLQECKGDRGKASEMLLLEDLDLPFLSHRNAFNSQNQDLGEVEPSKINSISSIFGGSCQTNGKPAGKEKKLPNPRKRKAQLSEPSIKPLGTESAAVVSEPVATRDKISAKRAKPKRCILLGFSTPCEQPYSSLAGLFPLTQISDQSADKSYFAAFEYKDMVTFAGNISKPLSYIVWKVFDSNVSPLGSNDDEVVPKMNDEDPDSYYLFPLVLLLVSAEDFVCLMTTKDSRERLAHQLREAFSPLSSQPFRIEIVIHGTERLIRKKMMDSQGTSFSVNLDDQWFLNRINWDRICMQLYIDHNLQSNRIEKVHDIGLYLQAITRGIYKYDQRRALLMRDEVAESSETLDKIRTEAMIACFRSDLPVHLCVVKNKKSLTLEDDKNQAALRGANKITPSKLLESSKSHRVQYMNMLLCVPGLSLDVAKRIEDQFPSFMGLASFVLASDPESEARKSKELSAKCKVNMGVAVRIVGLFNARNPNEFAKVK